MSFKPVAVSEIEPIGIAKATPAVPENKTSQLFGGKRHAGFPKGVSGNPGGVAKGTGELKKIAREWTESAIRTLGKVMDDPKAPPAARVAAASAILDRGHGKPTQQVEVGGPGAFASMSEAELDAFIASSVKLLRNQSAT